MTVLRPPVRQHHAGDPDRTTGADEPRLRPTWRRRARRAGVVAAVVAVAALGVALARVLFPPPAQFDSVVVSSPAELVAIPRIGEIGRVAPAPSIARSGAAKARRLVVVVPGMDGLHENWRGLVRQLMHESELAGSDWLLWRHQIAYFTPTSAADLAMRLRAAIDARWIAAGGYEDVVLVGYSFGALLARRAYLLSAGQAAGEPTTAAWADSVTRIVLLAALGGGSDYETRGRWGWVVSFLRRTSYLDGRVLYDQLQGSEFVAELKIEWLRYFGSLERRPTVVHLLGTEDENVTRADNLDVLQFPNAFHIDVPGSTHAGMLRPDPGTWPLKYALIREAFRKSGADTSGTREPSGDRARDVVFILHGIRARNPGWAAALADSVHRVAANATVIHSSYGHLSALGFALPGRRRRNITWLVDRYTEALVRNRLARMHVFAHSNGTYLLGEVLRRVPGMHFERVVLAGSVLPPDFPLAGLHGRGQIGEVLHERARADRIAGLLASALRGLGMNDVGTSGVVGFNDEGSFKRESGWYAGGHNAAVAPAELGRFARYLTSGALAPSARMNAGGPSTGFLRVSRSMPWITGAIAIAAVAGLLLWALAGGGRRPRRMAVVITIVFVAVALLDVL